MYFADALLSFFNKALCFLLYCLTLYFLFSNFVCVKQHNMVLSLKLMVKLQSFNSYSRPTSEVLTRNLKVVRDNFNKSKMGFVTYML